MERSYLAPLEWLQLRRISVHPNSTWVCIERASQRVPPPKAFDSSGPRLFLLGCLESGDPPLPFLPRQGQAMENACKSAQNLSFDEAAQATIQEEPNHVSPRTHGFVSGSSFVTCTRNSHQGWMDGYRRPWRQRGTWVGLLPIKSPKKPIKMFLVCPCEESTDEHRGK